MKEVLFFLLHALLFEAYLSEACVGDWSTATTKYRTLNFKGENYLHVSCNNKIFKVNGSDTVKCIGGKLPPLLPQCVWMKASCQSLAVPLYGSVKCSTTTLEEGSSCRFECQGTHYLRGSETRTCTSNLQWTGSIARCLLKPECREPPPLHNGTVTGCSPTRKPRFDDTCHFQCNEGFRLVGPHQLWCRMNGLLTNERGLQTFPRCEPTDPSAGTDEKILDSCQVRNGHCSHFCEQELDGVRCSCSSGYLLASDAKTCIAVVPSASPTPSDEDVRPSVRLSCQLSRGHCSHFCHQESNGIRCSCKPGYLLSPDGRTCIDVDECSDGRLNKCDHTCQNTDGGYICSCRAGFVSPDGFRCEDVDECSDTRWNKCDHTCQNTDGGYICSCRAGFVSPDGFRCEGCRVNSYQSAASCRDCPAHSHTDAGGKASIGDCTCDTGFTGNPGRGISCTDIDECADGKKFGCSHTCVNTPGGAHCACPVGYQLREDGKNCTDIDECALRNGGCDGICTNTDGNFTCSCPQGYEASKEDRYGCDDVDECSQDNGGCGGECVNFRGGFHCFCPEGFHLHPDGKACSPVLCPRVPFSHHSTLRCKNSTTSKDKEIFRPGEMAEDREFPVGAVCRIKCDRGYHVQDSHSQIVCQKDGKWSASLPHCTALQCPPLPPPANGDVYPPSCQNGSAAVKQRCVFTCRAGHRITGQEVLTCRNDLTWRRGKPTLCVPETDLSISCPDDDITVELGPEEGFAELRLNSPRTSAGPIRVHPPWVSLDRQSAFPAGVTEVTFAVTGGNQTAECSLSVIVLDKHPPVFPDCPEAVSSASGLAVTWEDPVPRDNVGIASVSKNLEPNATLDAGLHLVEYVARDFAGNIGRCLFHINVTTGAGCPDLPDPEHGEANCQEWLSGKICQPTCHHNYTRPEEELFVCDESGTWTPAHFISPCLPAHVI